MHIEIKESIYFREVDQDNSLVLVDIDSSDDYLVKLQGVARDFFMYIHNKKSDDINGLNEFLISKEYNDLDVDIIKKDFSEFISNLKKLNIIA